MLGGGRALKEVRRVVLGGGRALKEVRRVVLGGGRALKEVRRVVLGGGRVGDKGRGEKTRGRGGEEERDPHHETDLLHAIISTPTPFGVVVNKSSHF